MREGSLTERDRERQSRTDILKQREKVRESDTER